MWWTTITKVHRQKVCTSLKYYAARAGAICNSVHGKIFFLRLVSATYTCILVPLDSSTVTGCPSWSSSSTHFRWGGRGLLCGSLEPTLKCRETTSRASSKLWYAAVVLLGPKEQSCITFVCLYNWKPSILQVLLTVCVLKIRLVLIKYRISKRINMTVKAKLF